MAILISLNLRLVYCSFFAALSWAFVNTGRWDKELLQLGVPTAHNQTAFAVRFSTCLKFSTKSIGLRLLLSFLLLV
jgi:hypothetical protein